MGEPVTNHQQWNLPKLELGVLACSIAVCASVYLLMPSAGASVWLWVAAFIGLASHEVSYYRMHRSRLAALRKSEQNSPLPESR